MGSSRLFDLAGKSVLITGAAGGIGAAIAREFAACGAKVALLDRSEASLQSFEAELRESGAEVIALGADVQDEAQCKRATASAREAFGTLDVLINAAGINKRMRPEAYSAAVWSDIINVNLTGTFYMCQAAHAEMSQRGGKIVNIGSILSLVSNAMTAAYSASKGGVLQLTRSLACAWAEEGINVNAILPGWIDTPLSRQARIDIPGHAERVVQTTPLRRWGEPADIVGAALFLSSAASDFMTGAHLVVDGGVTAHA